MAVEWRDGIHIQGTSLWCDAHRAREVCFVSRADAVPPARHGQLIASAETLALMSRPGHRPLAALTPPFGRPFTLGTHRLELFAAGSAFGAASLAVDVGGQRVVYAGAIDPETADVRHCDTLIIDAEYGHPHYVFPDRRTVVANLVAFCQTVAASGGVAVLLLRRLGKVFDVGHALAETGLAMLAHRSFCDPIRRLVGLSGMPPLRRATPRPTGGRVLLWPVHARASLSGLTLPPSSAIALVSGTAVDSIQSSLSSSSLASGDALFPWADRAGHLDLLAYIRASGASRVFAVGRGAEPLLQALSMSGTCDTRELAPPQQMALF